MTTAPSNPNGPAILVVEDEGETRELVVRTLAIRYPEARLYAASSGAQGLELFRRHEPAIVITDMRMPVMDGLAMAAQIRSRDSEVELIALTAYSDTDLLVRAIDLGFSQYVFKPVVLERFFGAVDKAIEGVGLRRLVEEQNGRLKESERRFKATFDQAAVGIGHVDLDGTFLLLNRRFCDIVGCTPSAPAKDIYDFTHPDDEAACRERHEQLAARQITSYAMEKRYLHGDGNVVWAAMTVSLVVDEPSFLVVVLADITGRKRLEAEVAGLTEVLASRAAELEESNRDLKAFNYSVAHDLRQPLNMISGYCQALKQMCGGQLSPECLEYVRKAYDGTLRMNQLVTVLLQFAEAADSVPRYEEVDLSALAEDVAAELRITDHGRPVTFEIQGRLTARGDPHLLRVVLMNLLGNAWKYTAERPHALIRLERTTMEGGTVFLVRDNGIGFGADEAKEIFVPFRRIVAGERKEGFGVGLATVERIVRRHGGKVWAEGEPGKGATFYFTLGPGSS